MQTRARPSVPPRGLTPTLFPSPSRYLVACYLAEKDESTMFSPGQYNPVLLN